MAEEERNILNIAMSLGGAVAGLGGTATAYFNTAAFQGWEGALAAILVGTGTKFGFELAALGGGAAGRLTGGAGAMLLNRPRDEVSFSSKAAALAGGLATGIMGAQYGYNVSHNMVINGVADDKTEMLKDSASLEIPQYIIDALA